MTAYKFLATGAIGPLSQFAWPAPGIWIEAAGDLVPCRVGVHVCRADELAHWIHDELWAVEVAGDEIPGIDCLVVRRARLAHRVDAWSNGGHHRFGEACVAHARELAGSRFAELVNDASAAVETGYPAVAAYVAALVAARCSNDPESAYASERTWQGRWIAREVIGV